MVQSAALSFFDEVDPKQAVALAMETMKDPEPLARGRAAKHLGELGGPEAIAGLVETLKDKDTYVAAKAAVALAKLGDRRGLPALIRHFNDWPSDSDDEMCALADLGSKEIIPKAIARLGDKSWGTRRAALRSLEVLDAKEAAAKVEPLLEDSDDSVRFQAVSTLATLTGRASIPRLLALLHDKSSTMSVWAALRALVQLKAWDQEPEVARLLEDLEPSVRFLAASWLARAGSAKGVPELLDQDDWPHTALNALREPEVWKRLSGITLPADLPGTVLQKIEKVAQAAGLKVVVEPAPLGDSQRWLGRVSRQDYSLTGESALVALWALVPSSYAVVIDKDRLRLMTREAGERFWREWWKDYQTSKK
jgi:HEAT repeat protein